MSTVLTRRRAREFTETTTACSLKWARCGTCTPRSSSTLGASVQTKAPDDSRFHCMQLLGALLLSRCLFLDMAVAYSVSGDKKYHIWTNWGRVGEPGDQKLQVRAARNIDRCLAIDALRTRVST